jgi:hypothetical protein
MIIRTTYKCPKCKWIIYKRCKADLHTCYCGLLRCDGKVLENKEPIDNPDSELIKSIEVGQIELNTTEEKMILDFNYMGAKFGNIKPEKGK